MWVFASWISHVTKQYYSAYTDLNKNYLAVTNLHDGVDLYSVSSMQLIKTYSHGNANTAIFKVSFVNKSWLVSGGLDGVACLYDVQSGQLVQKLEHDPSKWPGDLDTVSVPDIFTSVGDIVQTVTVSNLEYVLVKYLHLHPEPYPAQKHYHYYSNLSHQSLD